MNVLVLNGSPKGKYSITLQTAEYIKARHPEHTFNVLHVGQTIHALERDFSPAVSAIENADLLLFSYPVYTFITPAQLHRFIELLKSSGSVLTGKFASQITTSKHFYDVTAHRFIQDNCLDLGLKFISGLSADMDDLLTEQGQSDADKFFEYLCHCIDSDCFTPLPPAPPTPAHRHVTVPVESDAEKPGNTVIVTDLDENDMQLADMIRRFRAVYPRKTKVVNIREFPFQGGCLGCFNCAVTGKCIYKDGFDQFLRDEIQSAEAMVFAFSIKDHSMGSRFKTYNDREFCNGHRTVTTGMSIGYLVSGDLSREYNLQMILDARAQVGGNFLAGIATDEFDPDTDIDKLSSTLAYAIEHKFSLPSNFYGVGGMKIFRDLIWLMQGMMKADHKFYKANGHYDFPQKKRGTMLKMYLVGALISNPNIKRKMGNAMSEGMIAPYRKILDRIQKN